MAPRPGTARLAAGSGPQPELKAIDSLVGTCDTQAAGKAAE
ncbi:MAG TPA: hypothetical protein VKE40_25185 [Gemmataceae bacterium]|nr:hypothetical protein [Gemmataceae bacterium]